MKRESCLPAAQSDGSRRVCPQVPQCPWRLTPARRVPPVPPPLALLQQAGARHPRRSRVSRPAPPTPLPPYAGRGVVAPPPQGMSRGKGLPLPPGPLAVLLCRRRTSPGGPARGRGSWGDVGGGCGSTGECLPASAEYARMVDGDCVEVGFSITCSCLHNLVWFSPQETSFAAQEGQDPLGPSHVELHHCWKGGGKILTPP